MRLALFALLLLPLGLRAQVSELGITGGVTYYIGDINPYQHYPARTRPMGGLFFRYNFGPRYALRFQALYGTLEAYDSDSPDSLQQLRNLGFKAHIFELGLLGEINFFPFRATGKESRNWTPFVFAGVAYFRANPRAQLDNTWYDLQPLGTEGQGSTGETGGTPYKVDQFCIPFGAGFKFALGKRVNLQLEWGLRRTYTDYIDDVSGVYANPNDLNPLAAELGDPSPVVADRTGQARGDSETRDWYQYTGLSLSVLLTKFTECDQLYFRMKR